MKKLLIFSFLFLAFSLYAHRVDIFPYIEGNKLMVECYFSDGTPAKNCKVEIYKGKEKILVGKTDNEGIASFPIDKIKGEVKIVLVAGMGHRAKTIYRMEEEEKPQMVEAPQIEKKENVVEKVKEGKEKYFDEKEIERKIELAVEKSIKPLIKMMEEEKRRIKFSEVVAGIGYILGIFGIIAILYRKK
ncbi:hypothetical protein J7L87_01000 [bacterium]|nr:hypothetical protein [bacterium]